MRLSDHYFLCLFWLLPQILLPVVSSLTVLRTKYLVGARQQHLGMTPRAKEDSQTNPGTSTSTTTLRPLLRRIVYITLEYCQEDLFSGNGVCARSQVRSLSILHSSSSFIQEVIVARPQHVLSSSSASSFHPSDTPPGVRLHVVPVSNWKTTDRSFDHATFALGVQETLESLLVAATTDGEEPPIDAIVAVDWTGMAGVNLMASKQSTFSQIPIFYLNFRVYSRMTDISEEDRSFYYQAESQAVQLALESGGAVVGICDSDTQFLQSMVKRPKHNSSPSPHRQQYHEDDPRDRVVTIFPMLRQEFADIAQRDQEYCLDAHRHRPYFGCIVRLSRDKGPQRFVELCQRITERDPTFWQRTQTIPFLAGAASQPDFAKEIITQLRQCVPNAVIIETFLNAETLSTYLQETRLNIHPAIYEAFGMTIVEAAACGAPTLLHNNGAIGAEQLLPMAKECSLGIDMEQDMESLTTQVMELLETHSASYLARIGFQAYHVAVSWTELAYVRVLWELVEKNTLASSRHRQSVE